MLIFIFLLEFFAVFTLVLAIHDTLRPEPRPTLKGLVDMPKEEKKKYSFFRHLVFFNKPLCAGPLGERLGRELVLARINISPEEFLFLKELLIGLLLFFTYPMSEPQSRMIWLITILAAGFYVPDFLVKIKIKKVKNLIIKELPDTIDLLSLCVNAGLDFLLALKWVIEKSAPSILIQELKHVLQEVHVGKPRRDALTDFANKYQIPDLSTFTRALVQADRMGTSVADALNIISEDMRISRFRRGEQIALKAPLKMLMPLLFCIFPVVAILVAGPVFLQFFQGNLIKGISG
ncbi:MAG: type II secretion system F family protein [Candidatus Omnitrophica bacterium]|nr:type II secretion system F family protein [Candidatus Omnitrophota bacterium]